MVNTVDPDDCTHISVLVGSDSDELRLRKAVRLQILLLMRTTAHLDDVDARLITMHGIQNDLRLEEMYGTT